MHRELLELYNRELALLYEYGQEFAEEYPGVAGRLGGLLRDRTDPMIAGLLEGVALLAARVQLKLKHEFGEFTNTLLEQLIPNYLAPTPSMMVAAVRPVFGDPGLREGKTIARGATLDAVYRERERDIACRFTLCGNITLWPFELTRAEYYPAPSQLQALRVDIGPDVAAGMRLTLRLRTVARAEDEPSDEAARTDPLAQFAGCALRDLPVYLVGPEADAIALYEQIFANLSGVHLRYLDDFGDPRTISLPASCVAQVGFDDGDELIPNESRLFSGFARLSEYFMFFRKFLGFRIRDLGKVLNRIKAKSLDVIFTFDKTNPRLAAAVTPPMFALFAAPAINLFKKNSDRIQIETNLHEYHVIPDRSQPLNFEPHRVLDVFLHRPGLTEKQRLLPVYMAHIDGRQTRADYHYTIRRLQRRRTAAERRFGIAGDYVGTEMYLTISAMNDTEMAGRPEVSVRALCSNRHLPEHLPVGAGGADFRFRDDATLDVFAVVPPTPPQEPLITQRHDIMTDEGMGRTAWLVINALSVNHHGLDQSDARALREVLMLFANAGDEVLTRRVSGIRRIDTRPVMRRLQQRLGVGAARGIEITVTVEEKAFEGSGAYLLGAVLDRFFAEYASVNHFTVTVIRSIERGVIARWPPRSGSRSAL
jgi:type VI secretion system protein ImpG